LAKSVQGGLRTNNEARRILGLNKIAGGDTVFMQQQMVPVSQLAARSDLNPPMMTPTPAQTPTRELPPPAPSPTLDKDALREALARAVFDDSSRPEPPPPVRHSRSVLAHRQAQRKLIYGRQPTYH
jgi:hypothetical protein